MRLGIFAKTFSRPDLASTLDAVVASGLDTMQFNLALTGGPSMPDAIPVALAADIREQTQRGALRMAAVSGTYNMAHPDTSRSPSSPSTTTSSTPPPPAGDCWTSSAPHG
jgi:sugar phosphate isomerase/epimerase